MAYVKQNWETGELITSQKLNHMEDGIAEGGGGGGGNYIVHASGDYSTVTVEENVDDIITAIESDQNVMMIYEDNYASKIYLHLDLYVPAEGQNPPRIDFDTILTAYNAGQTTNFSQIYITYYEGSWDITDKRFIINSN